MNETTLAICWIDVGRKVPKYLQRNLSLHETMHPNLKQYLITDCSFKPKTTNTEVVQIQELSESFLTSTFNQITEEKIIPFRQKNFWILTTKRFFYLYDFMVTLDLQRVLHLESDNLVLNADRLSRLLEEVPRGLAFPMQSEFEGCGSVFYVAERDSLKRFLEFVLDKWKISEENDMTLLGQFSKSDHVTVLPSKPNSELIVDPGAYGKYFVGSDARNFRIPMRKRGVVTDESTSRLHEMRSLKFRLSGPPIQLFLTENLSGEVLNLHLHSKEIPKSVNHLRKILIRSFVSHSPFWKFGRIDFLVLTERVLSKIARLLGLKEVRLR